MDTLLKSQTLKRPPSKARPGEVFGLQGAALKPSLFKAPPNSPLGLHFVPRGPPQHQIII